MKSAIGKITNICSLLLISFLIYINFALHSGPDPNDRQSTRQEVIRQLNFLEGELKNRNLGMRMQSLFPEGFVFVNALYGITWAEVARGEKGRTSLYKHALSEARYAYRQVNSAQGRSRFDPGLQPEYGIFYNGWKNYLLAKILDVQEEKNSSEMVEFKYNCEAIANAISGNQSPFPESYSGYSWPADAFVAVASLKLHDEIFETKYDSVIHDWLKKVKSRLDIESGLVPHSTDMATGSTIEGARGSSLCLMLIFLADIDPEFAVQQFILFQEKFKVTRFGLPAIREYPAGKDGEGDIDSGPVILDIGFAGTIVSVGTFRKFGEYKAAAKISANIKSFGCSTGNETEKKYLFGMLPMADAFIGWSEIIAPDNEIIQIKVTNNYDFGSINMFHFYCSLITLLLIAFILRKKIKRLLKLQPRVVPEPEPL